jgi:signal transduction histidine kinase
LLVWDRGAGIPEHVQREIFRPFVTTKGANGTGLGLWVAVSIAARHQGELRFRSSQRPGRNGTCFSLFLPLDGSVAVAEDSIGEMMKQIGSELLER